MDTSMDNIGRTTTFCIEERLIMAMRGWAAPISWPEFRSPGLRECLNDVVVHRLFPNTYETLIKMIASQTVDGFYIQDPRSTGYSEHELAFIKALQSLQGKDFEAWRAAFLCFLPEHAVRLVFPVCRWICAALKAEGYKVDARNLAS